MCKILFKVNNTETLFWYLLTMNRFHTLHSDVYIVDFDQANTGWDNLTSKSLDSCFDL